MNISIDLLVLKLRVLADLLDIVGLIGLGVFVAAMIWMVIRVANFDSPFPPLIGILLSLVLVAGGLACSPVSGEAAGLTAAAWLCNVLDVDLGEARKFVEENKEDLQEVLDLFGDFDISGLFGSGDSGKDLEENPAEAGDQDADEDAAQTADREQPEDGTLRSAADSLQNNANLARAGFLCDEILDGWRIRLTLPEEWKDICVIENGGSYLEFSQKASIMDIYDGWLFDLSVQDDSFDPWTDGPPAFDIVLKKDGVILLAEYPSDVRFNPENGEIMEEYNRMQAAIPGILDTAELERV